MVQSPLYIWAGVLTLHSFEQRKVPPECWNTQCVCHLFRSLWLVQWPCVVYSSSSALAPPKRRKAKYVKAFEYLLHPHLINQQAIKDGTAIFVILSWHIRIVLQDTGGIKYNVIITIRNPVPDRAPLKCIVAATNLSKRNDSAFPRTDIIEKAKEFLGTIEEPKGTNRMFTVMMVIPWPSYSAVTY